MVHQPPHIHQHTPHPTSPLLNTTSTFPAALSTPATPPSHLNPFVSDPHPITSQPHKPHKAT
ncbi:hypothetical protein E2C01_098713 [Portunus trituberculatus]|uniref:Uncharacterized protein n=1 Tax=Portunus trituberculatus TaxID=210409 RepID=A0A5B7K8Y4_PORTR|nr:hypothetical protein [Portunus trituberculatus]